MSRVSRINVQLSAVVFAISQLFSASANAADAVCSQWDVSGPWTLIQTNDTAVAVTLKPTPGGFTGLASFGHWKDDDFWLCSIGDCGRDYVGFSGPAVGSISGDSFELTVYWNDNSIGVYSGKIGPQGLIVGSAYDKNNPANRADWHSDRVAICASAAASAPPPPPASNKPAVALGRVQTTGAPAPEKTLCESAASARARNSPAAPGLERQCAAATAQAEQAAKAARAAGPALDQAWQDGNAAKGEALAAQDPLATELRNLVPEGKSRRGFDYGMAVAETDTAPGPGKQLIRDALGPDEQIGFDFAVQYSIARNANADLAAKGAAVVLADPELASARESQLAGLMAGPRMAEYPDVAVFFKLGFNVAAGRFGDQALGGMGNTAMGPGSTRIRNSLPAGGAQTGFDGGADFLIRRSAAK